MHWFPHFTATQPKNPNSVSHTLFVQFQDYFFPEYVHCLNRDFIFKLSFFFFFLSFFILFVILFIMSPAATATALATPTAPTTIGALPGHVENLTGAQIDMLKAMWSRLFELFKQKGTEYKPEPKTEKAPSVKKTGWFGKKAATEEKSTDVFLGTTTDPSWMSLPLEKALPLIPGTQLRATFWNMVATDNPDAVVLRFLRARKWDIDAAYSMITNTLRWRLHMRVDDIVALGENGIRDELNKLQPDLGDCFITQLNSGKAYLGGPDKADRGIW